MHKGELGVVVLELAELEVPHDSAELVSREFIQRNFGYPVSDEV